MTRDDPTLRREMLAALRRLDALGLNRGSTGNLSHRVGGEAMLITPTGMGAAEIGEHDFVRLSFDGTRQGRWRPSSETPFHLALYEARPELNAVVHVHSVHATALACLGRDLPPFHYMVAVAGGDSVRCAPYHLFGSSELSAAVVKAMQDRKACLLANHGLVAAAPTLAEAMKITLEVEALCQSYLAALAVGKPVLLSAAQMVQVAERFAGYGQPRAAAAGDGEAG